MKTKRKTVYVGLSGGVDSSLSAALLQRDFTVVGVFIKVWTPEFLPCTWREDRRDAMRVAAHLGIPFITLDLEKEYKKEVVDYMIHEYKLGRTPNPDVMCNKEIKFGAFYDFAMKSGADFVATGHYAQVYESRDGNYELREGKDKNKDQSYFIWNIKKDQLPHVLFPIGGMLKSNVRKLAKKYHLPNFEKKDSQGLCFLGKVDMKEFLMHFIKEKKGNVLNEKGEKIGIHDGVMFLTIGQRHGFSTTNKKTSSNPLYIIAKDIKKNTVTVSTLKPELINSIAKNNCIITETNWISEPSLEKPYSVRFRYHQKPLEGKLSKKGAQWIINLNSPFIGMSPGQSAVIYDKERLIGAGIIS